MLAAVPAVRVPNVHEQMQGAAAERHGRSVVEAFRDSGLERILTAGSTLVRAGERKTHVYRVESGLVCSYWHDPVAGRKAVAFCFTGDLVGLGGLDKHIVTVEAGADTVVQCLPRGELDDLHIEDEHLAARHAEATDIELQLLREGLVAQGRAATLERVAALLTVLAAGNAHEGRAQDIITDDITCGFVADQLGIEIAVLEEALIGLGKIGVVEALPDGTLRLCDRAALERLADGQA